MRRELHECSWQELFFCALMPVFWMLAVWALLGQRMMTKLPVALVDQDYSPQSREIARAIDSSRAFGLVSCGNVEMAMALMRSGEVYGVIVFPYGYAKEKLSGRGGTVAFYIDETAMQRREGYRRT